MAIAYPTLAECYTLVLRGWAALNPEGADFLSGCSLLSKFRDQPLTMFDAVATTGPHPMSEG